MAVRIIPLLLGFPFVTLTLAVLKEMKKTGFDLIAHAQNKKKCVDIYRSHQNLPPLEPISLNDLLGTKLIKYAWNGKRLMLNPDPNAFPDREDLENFKILKLALPHPQRDPELLDVVCKAFDYDEDTYRVVYDKHLACFSLITECENPWAYDDECEERESEPDDGIANAMEALKEKWAKETALEAAADDSVTYGDTTDSGEIDSPSPAKAKASAKAPLLDCLSQVAACFERSSSFDSHAAVEELMASPPTKKKKYSFPYSVDSDVKSPQY
ncbi:unknown protein [Seminavis robusta]|uniref:Uncharacterized protein n=1 Tax=Seminavis robusta TaxID=568900 RepID=A0A9N8EPG4_9STRA|nr:unknown protein [Seminavis robusta]|eukprot:Sro1450_g273750.1 n/a (270) ;mRNA; f:4327-5136